MSAPAIIAVVAIVIGIVVQGYGLVMTARQVRRVYGRGGMARRMFVRTGWPHAVNVGGMLAWAGLLTWGGFWS